MPPISRRIFLAASAGIAANGAAAQVPQPATTDFRLPDSLDEPTSDRLGPWARDLNFVFVDFHGARGDCPAIGSTDGASDDSDAIESALLACPDGGMVRFSPGKCYMVSRPIAVLGKQINIDARGARIRCRNDSVWHVFTFGGETSDRMVEEVAVWGGIWDGNRAKQRYWPNTDGKKVFTDQGVEEWGRHGGRTFYENSPVNGTLWRSGWIKGEAGDGINVNGGGNDGLIRIQHARQATYHCCTARDWVRNGFVTWHCHNTLFLNPQGSGQLPTHYAELEMLFSDRAEAAFLKASGGNPQDQALRGDFPHSVKVLGGCCLGGVMPIFCRTNVPKPEAAANQVVVDGFEAYGFSRDVWFEEVSDVRISKCQLVGIYAPNSTVRASAGVFLSNGTTDWSISDSYVRGHIDTRQMQDNRLGSLSNVVLECDAALDDWIVRCETISNAVIRARGRGAACINAVSVDARAEMNASLFIEGSAVNCCIGADRFEGSRIVLDLQEGQRSIDLEISYLDGLVLLRRMNSEIQGGKWYDIHHSAYELQGGQIRFQNAARTGDRIEATWYEVRRDSFRCDGDQTRFALTKAGASRTSDVLSVTLDGSEVPSVAQTRDEAAPQFAVLAPERGLRQIELHNLRPRRGSTVEVVYRPPLVPFAGLRLKGKARPVRADVICRNVRSVEVEGEAALTGWFEDIAGLAAFRLHDGTELSLHDATVRRSRGGILSGANRRAAPARLRIVDCLFEDWGLDGDVLSDEEARAVGGNAKPGLTVTDWAIVQGNTWMRSGRETGASDDPGRLRPLPMASVSGNIYVGTAGQLQLRAEHEISP